MSVDAIGKKFTALVKSGEVVYNEKLGYQSAEYYKLSPKFD